MVKRFLVIVSQQGKVTLIVQLLPNAYRCKVHKASLPALLVHDNDSLLHVVQQKLIVAAGQLRIYVGEADPRQEDVHQRLAYNYHECMRHNRSQSIHVCFI